MTTHTGRQSGPAKPLAPVVALDRNAARAAISVAAERFTALLRETDDLECPAAGTDWSVAETAAHVSCVFTGFSAAIAGELPALTYLQADFPTRLAASNASTIATVDHADAGRLAELIAAGAQRFLELAAAADPEMECETPWYGPGRTRTLGLPHRPCAVGADRARARHRGRDGPAMADLR